MKAKLGVLLMFAGTILVAAALGLFLNNQQEARMAQQSTEALLPKLIEEIQVDATLDYTIPDVPEETVSAAPLDTTMKEVIIQGRAYIGYLSIPKLELELPILSQWDYPGLQVAPCRYSGTLLENNLVLMAHNYAKHFGRLSELTEGDSVVFVDVDGISISYQVQAKDVLEPTAVEEMISGAFDLTLFTCTYGGASRVTVYCDRD